MIEKTPDAPANAPGTADAAAGRTPAGHSDDTTMTVEKDGVWIDTDETGFIVDWGPGALALTGYSARGTKGRELPMMIVENRPRVTELVAVARGAVLQGNAVIRPHDRRGIPVMFQVAVAGPSKDRPLLRWTFHVRSES
jgi:PAS domain-containing protein